MLGYALSGNATEAGEAAINGRERYSFVRWLNANIKPYAISYNVDKTPEGYIVEVAFRKNKTYVIQIPKYQLDGPIPYISPIRTPEPFIRPDKTEYLIVGATAYNYHAEGIIKNYLLKELQSAKIGLSFTVTL